MGIRRRAGIAGALVGAQLGLAYRFALAYRARAGYPRRDPPRVSPSDLGLPFESTTVPSAGLDLPAWFIPARDGARGPGVVLVHGWESGRDRTLPMAVFLHAAGFHCLTFDVRGNGANPPEALPLSAGEFGQDAAAAFDTLMRRPEVTVGAISGHSMGAIGAILAGAADPRVAAVVATSGPADPYRLTRQTFRLAHLPIPDPIAYPLAWLTTRVYLRPRGHDVRSTSASGGVRPLSRPDPARPRRGGRGHAVEPPRATRARGAGGSPRRSGCRTGRDPADRRRPALLAVREPHLQAGRGPLPRGGVRRPARSPPLAGEIAAATAAERLPDGEPRFEAIAESPSGIRTLVGVALPGATRPPEQSGTPKAIATLRGEP